VQQIAAQEHIILCILMPPEAAAAAAAKDSSDWRCRPPWMRIHRSGSECHNQCTVGEVSNQLVTNEVVTKVEGQLLVAFVTGLIS